MILKLLLFILIFICVRFLVIKIFSKILDRKIKE
jgi:hypothetical protein